MDVIIAMPKNRNYPLPLTLLLTWSRSLYDK